MSKHSEIDFSDLQGLLRFGHGHLTEACFLLLQVNDVETARNWLLTAPVTSAVKDKELPTQALQIAFSSAGLRAMQLDETVINEFSAEFIDGMVGDENRSRRLGDIGNNHPDNWEWGSQQQTLADLLVMVYATADGLEDWQLKVQSNGFNEAFSVITTLTTTTSSANLEPFGFVDGISQPDIDWQQSVSTDLHERDDYSNLLALGEVVLGYPNEYGLYTERPLLDPELQPQAVNLPVAKDHPELRDLGCNGSYLVLRQLSQDVPGFWQFIDQASGSNPEQRDQLAAAMVGRQRDGKPLAEISTHEIAGINNKAAHRAVNHFTFDADPHGHTCPIGAHVRRANPRTGDFPSGVSGMISRLIRTFGFGRRYPREDLVASSRFHRILRRGRAYGTQLTPEDAIKADAPVEDRGLHFVCLGANISRQFDFVQNAWSMSAKFSGLPNESDPLLGHRQPLLNGDGTDTFTLPQASAPTRCIASLPQFVTVLGGGYFFMPGIKALHYIANAIPSEK